MAEVTEHYDNEAERQAIIASWNAQGYWVLHDDYDPDWIPGTELHGTLTFTNTAVPLTPEQLYQEQLVAEFNAAHEQAILAYKNWGSLTLAQKDAILKGLVKWALWKDGWLKLGVI